MKISSCPLFLLSSFFFFFFGGAVFLGPYPWHMEVPRLGVKLKLQLQASTTATAKPYLSHLHHSSQQHQIINPLSEARDQTCILMDPSHIHFHWATTEIPRKREFDENTIIEGLGLGLDFNATLTSKDGSSRHKINKATEILNDTIKQLHLIDIFRTLHPKKIRIYVLFKCT